MKSLDDCTVRDTPVFLDDPKGIDLQARPIYHSTRDSIQVHLSVVFAAMAISHWIEHQTGWSIKKFLLSTRRCRTVTIQVGNHTLTAAEVIEVR
jgi:hypothetical protein